jgi:DMSO/TMAO reductase YedYZ molybdopterin-dependent catalytic subunit
VRLIPRVLTVVALLGVLSPRPIAGGEPADETMTIVTVSGEIAKPMKLTAKDWAKLPRQSVKARDHSGVEAEYEGVPLVEVLKEAGVKFGQDLRGPALASYLVVEATDGYKAVFALPELDPAFNDRMILLADRRDGKPLDAKHGPVQVIVPGEKKQARWVRMVVTLRIAKA